MSELPMSILKASRRYEPIKTGDIVLYPILTGEYSEYLAAKPAIEVMHQSLPVAYLRMPLLAALYQMDYDAATSGKLPSELFARTLLALALSLRLGTGLEPSERVQMFQIAVDREKPGTLLRIIFTDKDGAERSITPAQYQTVRQIIAVQNGVKIEDETANPDLVKAQKDMASAGGITLDPNVDDLISAISALSGADEAEIDEWPILRLERKTEAYKRILDYIVCGIGEMSGTTWKGGNPTPHPFFKRLQTGNPALSLLGGGGISTAGNAPSDAVKMAQETQHL